MNELAGAPRLLRPLTPPPANARSTWPPLLAPRARGFQPSVVSASDSSDDGRWGPDLPDSLWKLPPQDSSSIASQGCIRRWPPPSVSSVDRDGADDREARLDAGRTRRADPDVDGVRASRLRLPADHGNGPFPVLMSHGPYAKELPFRRASRACGNRRWRSSPTVVRWLLETVPGLR